MGSISIISTNNNELKLAGDPIPSLEPIVPSPNFDGIVVLKWSLVDGAGGYAIYQIDPQGVRTQIVYNTRRDSYQITGLTSGIWQFQVRVKYTTRFGESSNIVSIEVIIGGVLPTEPTEPTGSINYIYLIVGFVLIGGIFGFIIYRKVKK